MHCREVIKEKAAPFFVAFANQVEQYVSDFNSALERGVVVQRPSEFIISVFTPGDFVHVKAALMNQVVHYNRQTVKGFSSLRDSPMQWEFKVQKENGEVLLNDLHYEALAREFLRPIFESFIPK